MLSESLQAGFGVVNPDAALAQLPGARAVSFEAIATQTLWLRRFLAEETKHVRNDSDVIYRSKPASNSVGFGGLILRGVESAYSLS
ncbi:MAG: hypothetical protein Kow0040_11990 [Thermogutta sp.]